MGGLSKDPEKAQNQLDALAAGRRALAESILSPGKEPPPAKAAAKASNGSPDDRVSYTEPEEEPNAPGPREEPEPEPERRPGFVDGLLGRL